mgnify:CR=1 FL=1
MTHIVTSLCVRDRGCIEVCPVECMVPGQPVGEWPWIYIDPDTCIDCGACVPECPYDAIFPEEDVPSEYTMGAGVEYVPHGGTRTKAAGGEVFDLTEDNKYNYDFFSERPGYDAQ